MKPKFVSEVPKSAQGRSVSVPPKYYRTALVLKKHPGDWAHIMQDASHSTVSMIKKGTLVAFAPAGSFEAKARKNGKKVGKNKGKADIYARYIGEPKTEV